MMSPVEKIDDLQFYAMPTKPTAIKKAIRIGNTIVCIGENGRLYTDSRLAGKYCYTPGVWPWLIDTMKALVKLGVLDQKAVDEHMKAAKAADDRRDRKWACEKLNEIEKQFGVKFTASQMKAVSDGARR